MKWKENYKELWEYAPNRNNFGKNAPEVKELQPEMRFLIAEGKEKHHDYLWNVQSPFLKIEKQMVKDHKHEYPEYIEFMEKATEWDKYIKENTSRRKAIKNRIRELRNNEK